MHSAGIFQQSKNELIICRCADGLRCVPHGHWYISTLTNQQIIKTLRI